MNGGNNTQYAGGQEEGLGPGATPPERTSAGTRDDLRRPDPPAAMRLNRLAVVVAAAVMSGTLLVIAFAVGGAEREEAEARRQQAEVHRPMRPGGGDVFYDRPVGVDTVVNGAQGDPLSGLPGADLYEAEDSPGPAPAGSVTGARLEPPPYGHPYSSPYGQTAAYYERSAPTGASPSHRSSSPEEQVLERAKRSGLRPQGFTGHPSGGPGGSAPGADLNAAGAPAGENPFGAAQLETLEALRDLTAAGAGQSSASGVGLPPGLVPSLPGGTPNAALEAATPHPGERARQFVREAVAMRQSGQNYMARAIEQPISRYEVREGTLVEAFLLTGIHSDLPGEVVAQVARNVYDSETQQVVLIPKGSRLIGTYDNQIALDQSRLLVAWTRLVFPDGRSLTLPGLASKDPTGASGLRGRVNRHYWQAFGGALMLAVVGGSLSYATSRERRAGSFGYPSPGEILAGSVATELSRVATELLRGRVMRRPTVRIAEGTRFNVFINGDLALLPYAPQDGFMGQGRTVHTGGTLPGSY